MTTKASPEEFQAVEAKVKELLQAIQLDVNLESETQEDRLYFNVSGPDARIFLNNREETLRSITLLLHTWRQKAFPDSEMDIKFDANRVLFEREKEVRAQAFSALDEIKQPGDEVVLEPMNPYERRMVHMALVDHDHIVTESLGDSHMKRVVVRHK